MSDRDLRQIVLLFILTAAAIALFSLAACSSHEELATVYDSPSILCDQSGEYLVTSEDGTITSIEPL